MATIFSLLDTRGIKFKIPDKLHAAHEPQKQITLLKVQACWHTGLEIVQGITPNNKIHLKMNSSQAPSLEDVFLIYMPLLALEYKSV